MTDNRRKGKRGRKDYFKAREELSSFYGTNHINSETYTPFDQLIPSTMTVIGIINRKLNLRDIFWNLRIEKVDFVRNRGRRVKVDVMGSPGSIISARFLDMGEGVFRGIDTESGFFRNSITMIISLRDKNVNLKLFPQKIQLTGCKTIEHAHEAIDYIINFLLYLESCGLDIYDNKDSPRDGKKKGKTLRIIDDIDTTCLKFSPPLDDIIQDTLLKPRGSLKLTQLNTGMRNYDFNLGFAIDRIKLDREIDGIEGFISEYEAGLNNGVTVSMLLDDSDNVETRYTVGDIEIVCTPIQPKNKKPPAVKFIVFRSGAVLYNGKNYQVMERIYTLFRDSILKIKDKIKDNSEDS